MEAQHSPHETIPADEHEAIERVVALVLEKLQADYESIRPALRGQHPKSHGCVKAEFVVGSDVPADLQHGLFAKPGTYDASIRFSASAAPPKPDLKRGAHGMSIKVIDVEGETILKDTRPTSPDSPLENQDFCLVNHNVFFCRNASDYADFAEAITAGGAEGGWATWPRTLSFFSPPNRANRGGLVNLARVLSKKVVNPLQMQQWSQTPFALGPHAVKYSARPQQLAAHRRPAPSGDNGLEEAMARSLRRAGASFDFLAQRQADARSMPVEDATVVWKESGSPFRKVATIWIPAQDFTSQAQRNFAEGLFFTPWHSLPEHAPLGGINRVRKAVYEASFQLRNEMNGVRPRSAGG